MTTALTPIITQLELDRDRFKVLINGTVDDTVQLEFRVEKSIAGQIRDRIDGLALDLITAVNNAQTFANNAEAAANNAADRVTDAQAAQAAAELARDQALAAKSDSETARDETEVFHGETKIFRDEAEDILQSAQRAATPGFVALDIQMIQPYQTESSECRISPSGFSVMGTPFTGINDRVKWISRTFEIYDTNQTTMDEALSISELIDMEVATLKLSETTMEHSHYIGNVGYTTNIHAARFIDTYISLDDPSASEPQSRENEHYSAWVFFVVDATKQFINRPTLSTDNRLNNSPLTMSFSISAPTGTASGAITSTYLMITDETGKVAYDRLVAGKQQTISVPRGRLETGKTYKAYAQYIANTSSALEPLEPPIRSAYSLPVQFTTETTSSYIPFYNTKSVVSTSVIDVESATVHRVNAAANKTLTLSKSTLPNNVAQTIVVFVEDSGGVITWPTEVSWAGGNEPTLGTTWTLVNLFWTGSMWIGMEGSKR